MILLSALACVTSAIAIKRVVDYCRYRNGYSNNKSGSSKTDSSLAESQEVFNILFNERRRRELEREQSQQRIILIKDSKVFLVKGDDDEY